MKGTAHALFRVATRHRICVVIMLITAAIMLITAGIMFITEVITCVRMEAAAIHRQNILSHNKYTQKQQKQQESCTKAKR